MQTAKCTQWYEGTNNLCHVQSRNVVPLWRKDGLLILWASILTCPSHYYCVKSLLTVLSHHNWRHSSETFIQHHWWLLWCGYEFDVTASQYYIITKGMVQRPSLNICGDLMMWVWVFQGSTIVVVDWYTLELYSNRAGSLQSGLLNGKLLAYINHLLSHTLQKGLLLVVETDPCPA